MYNLLYPNLGVGEPKEAVVGVSGYTDPTRSRKYYGTTLKFFSLQMRFERLPIIQRGTRLSRWFFILVGDGTFLWFFLIFGVCVRNRIVGLHWMDIRVCVASDVQFWIGKKHIYLFIYFKIFNKYHNIRPELCRKFKCIASVISTK